jgi:hypothetical protein
MTQEIMQKESDLMSLGKPRVSHQLLLLSIVLLVMAGIAVAQMGVKRVYTGHYKNSKGGEGDASLVFFEHRDREVEGEWDGSRFHGSWARDVISFELHNVDQCRDYWVHCEFSPSKEHATVTYKVHDRCGQPSHYDGTERLTRQ